MLAIFAAYANSFAGAFVYDDKPSITDNPTLHSLWPLSTVLSPPGGGATVSGRPVLNLSFAINYVFGRDAVFGYHFANVLIHALAALTLFALVRRTLALPALRPRFGANALPAAFAIALLWGLHPLQTEAITYIVQRAESLMALFYLVTLYAFLRSTQSPAPFAWQALSFGACLLGMATKENMVSAPVLVLLFDRAFVAKSFVAAWRERRRFYGALAATWILLAALVLRTGGTRDGSAGFGVGTAWWDYALTQFPAIVRYLALSFWPSPLVFDYGTFWIASFRDVALPALLVTALVGGTFYALWRRPMLGFLGGLFLAVLAPTSLMPGTTQMIVEHRMYLPLAAVLALLVPPIFFGGSLRALIPLLALAAAFGWLTHRRNLDYRTEAGIWQDTVAKRPQSVTAHSNLGSVLALAGRMNEAIAEDEFTLRLQPGHVVALTNLGNAFNETGRPLEALPALERAVQLNPAYSTAHLNLGVTLDLLKRPAEALHQYEIAFRSEPHSHYVLNNFGDALSRAGRGAEGITHLEEAVRLKPDYAAARYNLASALLRAGRLADAKAQFAAGLKLQPADAEAVGNWATILAATNHFPEAAAQYETALTLQPGNAVIHYNYGTACAAAGRLEEARAQFAEAVRLNPDYAEAHDNLGNTLTELGRDSEALPHYETAVRLHPDSPIAHNNLGLALARLGRVAEALPHFETAVHLAPNYQSAQDNLAHARAELSVK